MTISRNFERFQYHNFDADFLENENIFQKTGYRLLVESTKIENISLSCETAISEATFKTYRMVSTKWSYHNGVLPVTATFLKILFQFRNSRQELIWFTNDPNAHITTFCKC